MNRLLLLIYQIIFISCQSNDSDSPEKKGTRIISFSGYDWVVHSSGTSKQGPGTNYFSDSEDNVWVDERGRLHLKIVQRNGNWYCSKISLHQSCGYGKFVFYVDSRVDELDKNVVGGLYTYLSDEQEVDIEFSKWGVTDNENCQFAVQPSFHTGNKKRFYLYLESDRSTHLFNWQKDRIDFASFQGHDLNPPENKIIKKWSYTGKDIPTDSDEQLKMNLWLFKGNAPSDNKEQEMIISNFEIY